VLCRSQQRLAKDHAIRSKHEQRLLADIDKLSRRIADKRLVKPEKINQAIGRLKERYPRVARYYNLSHDPQTANLVAALDPDKHAKAERLDGCYLLKTNRKDLSGDELWRIYALLTRAESAFRDMKSPLAERPIFHSDADFQHALAWRILLSVPDAQVRLEYRLQLAERIYLDLWVRTADGSVALELKYPTRKLQCRVAGEEFALKDQSAQDVRRYDFIKDIARLEQVVAAAPSREH